MAELISTDSMSTALMPTDITPRVMTRKALISTDGALKVSLETLDHLMITATPKMAPDIGKDLTREDLILKESINSPILHSTSSDLPPMAELISTDSMSTALMSTVLMRKVSTALVSTLLVSILMVTTWQDLMSMDSTEQVLM